MSLNKKSFFVILIPLGIAACTNKSANNKPIARGKNNELLVVLDKTKFETTPLGDSIINIFQAEIYNLPQPEPTFDLLNVSEEGFNSFLQQHKNILFFDINNTHTTDVLEIKQDVFAQSQIFLRIKAKNDSTALKLLIKEKDRIITNIQSKSFERMANDYQDIVDKQIVKRLQKKMKLNMIVPQGFEWVMDTSDFIWLKYDTQKKIQKLSHPINRGIFIYTYNYKDTNTFSTKYLINKRDSFLMANVPGPLPNSYMTTDTILPPLAYALNLNNNYTFVMKGLWRTKGFFMGGPFISYTFLDKNTNKIVTAEAYVFAPKFDKRDYISQLEAIIRTIKVNNNAVN